MYFQMLDFILNHKELTTLIFSGVVALSTVVYAILTAILVTETRQMRRAQTEPKVVAYVKPAEEYMNFAFLYFENVGPGPAFDISFKLSSGYNDEGAKALIEDFSKARFLETGVEYIGPAQKIKSQFTQFTEKFELKIKAVIQIQLEYSSSTGQKYTEKYSIDMSQFEGAGSLGTPHLYSIAQSLKKIQEDVHKISSGFNKVKVETYTHADRERAKAEWEKYRKQIIDSSSDEDKQRT